jgi:hypothetical protein
MFTRTQGSFREMDMATKSDLLNKIYDDEYLLQYFETALWSSADERDEYGGDPLDKNYGIEDFTVDSLKKMIVGAEAFIKKPKVEKAIEKAGGDYGQAGHDFWLTRNGHGAGFWDGDWPEPEATTLTTASEKMGEIDLYVSNGKIHVF